MMGDRAGPPDAASSPETVHRDTALPHTLDRRTIGRAARLLPLLLLAACMRFHQPEVRLETVRLGSLGLSGGTVYASLVVINPNTYELRSSALDFTLDLRGPHSSGREWVRIAEGRLDRDLSVRAGDSARIDVPVDFNWSGVGNGLRSVMERGLVEYRLAGDLDVTRPVHRSVPFRRTGEVDLVSQR